MKVLVFIFLHDPYRKSSKVHFSGMFNAQGSFSSLTVHNSAFCFV